MIRFRSLYDLCMMILIICFFAIGCGGGSSSDSARIDDDEALDAPSDSRRLGARYHTIPVAISQGLGQSHCKGNGPRRLQVFDFAARDAI